MSCRFAALSFALVASCGTDYAAPSGTGSTTGSDADPVDVYAANCASCHGADAEGTTSGPQIREPVHGFATYVIRNGRSAQMGFGQAMPAFATDEVSDLDLTAIFTYLDRAPRPTDGAGLYGRFCANCHGADAAGGRVGESPKEDRDEIAEKVREGKGGTSYGSTKKYMPAWTSAQLSDAEVALIADYLATLPGGDDGDDGDDDDD